jgi:hypothetical protein
MWHWAPAFDQHDQLKFRRKNIALASSFYVAAEFERDRPPAVGEMIMSTDPLTEELIQIARAQTALLSSEFIAPVTRGCGVLVRLAGAWCSMMIVPPSFEGWGVFRPLSRTVALCCRSATEAERHDYLAVLAGVPAVKNSAFARAIDGRFGECEFSRDRAELGGPSAGSLGICLLGGAGKLDATCLEDLRRAGDGISRRWQ